MKEMVFAHAAYFVILIRLKRTELASMCRKISVSSSAGIPLILLNALFFYVLYLYLYVNQSNKF